MSRIQFRATNASFFCNIRCHRSVLFAMQKENAASADSIRKNRWINDVRFTVVQYAPGTERIRSHCPDGQFWLMLHGGWHTRITGRTPNDCEPFSLSYHIPGEKNRRQVGTAGARLFGIQIPHRLLSASPLLSCRDQPIFQEKGAANIVAMRLFRAFAEEDTASNLIVEEVLAELTALTFGRQPKINGKREPRWTNRVCEILREQHTEPLTLNEIAAACAVHPAYLTAAFRHRFGCRIGEYLRRLRLETALHHLCNTEAEIASIAHEAGFYDQAHFTRIFKAHLGITPGALRRLIHRI